MKAGARLPADRHARRPGAGAARGPCARRPHRGGGDRQRRSGAVLGLPAAGGLEARAGAARGPLAQLERTRSSSRAGVPWSTDGERARRPSRHARAERAREWLETMTLIRRFEERAGEMYARAKVGGFLHLSIGEEATIVGSARALRDDDYLISTYRSHGHALVRGTPPEKVMAELFGRVDGCSRRARRLDAHVRPRAALHGRLRDRRRQPADRGGHRAGERLPGQRRGDAVHVRRRRLQPGHVRRDAEPRGAVAAAGRVHGDQQPVRHGHRAARATPP